MRLVESIFCYVDEIDPAVTIFVAYEDERAVDYSIPTEKLAAIDPKEGDPFWVDHFQDEDGEDKVVIRRYEAEAPIMPADDDDFLTPEELRAISDTWDDA